MRTPHRRQKTFRNSNANQARSAQPLQFESLEPRSLMAASIFFDPATYSVRIDGDSLNDVVTITRLAQGTSSIYDDQLQVTATGDSQFSKTRIVTFNLWATDGVDWYQKINLIKFKGYEGHDIFRNNTDIPSLADGGAGNDILAGGSAPDTLYGGGGLDRLYGNGSSDTLDGGVPGVATYADNTGDDFLYGGAGNDTLHASDYGHNSLFGEGDDDRLFGYQGNDVLDGGSGNDTLSGYSGNDRLIGGSGNDSYTFQGAIGSEVDTIVELSGGGIDTLNFAALVASVPVRVNMLIDFELATHAGRKVNTGASSQAAYFENVIGGAGNDSLYGNAAANVLVGGQGNDGLFGAGGIDTLWGNAGPGMSSAGGGADRFLNRDGDLTPDFGSGYDAVINFVNAPAQTMPLTGFGNVSFAAGNWGDGEIIQVDIALGNLHNFLPNTRLLRQANGTGSLTFQRVGSQTTMLNTSFGGWNSGNGTIALTDGNFFLATGNIGLFQTVYHEIGHNWDDPSENPHSAAFRQLSDWQQSPSQPSANHLASGAPDDDWWYEDSAQFARPDTFGTTNSYSRWNPFEDYATTWEAYFNQAFHGHTNGRNVVTAKHENLDLLFSDLLRLT